MSDLIDRQAASKMQNVVNLRMINGICHNRTSHSDSGSS